MGYGLRPHRKRAQGVQMRYISSTVALVLLVAAFAIVFRGTQSVSIPVRRNVLDAEFMRISLEIQVLYQMESALLTSLQNEGSK